MSENFEGKFGINRGREMKHNFGFNMLSTVNVGIEGRKVVGEIESRRGKHGRYFFKQMYEEKESFRQLEKYKHLKAGGVSVPPVFKPVKLENGEPFVAVSDLTENGKYWVLGMNNPEADEEKFKKIAKSIPKETRDKIIQQMILACEIAAKPPKNKKGKEIIYEFQNNAFILALDPDNVVDARIYVADLGLDVMERRPEEADEVLRRNISSAATFYSWMTGGPFSVPEKYKEMTTDLDKNSTEVLEYRKFE